MTLLFCVGAFCVMRKGNDFMAIIKKSNLVVVSKGKKLISSPEKAMAEHVVRWLKEQGWEVWQEVQFYTYQQTHDIVAVKNGVTWTIECKTTMNLTVIAQAHRADSCFKSIAVPNPSSSTSYNFGDRICRDYGIGIINVNNLGHVTSCTSKIHRFGYKNRKVIIEKLKSIPQNYCQAGSQHGRWTPYRETMDSCKLFIKLNPGCTLKELMAGIEKHHYSSDKTARSSVRISLEKYEKWCSVTDGKYFCA